MKNEETMYKKILRCLTKDIFKFLHGLSPPLMDNTFEVRVNIYILRNFQSLYSTWKKTVRLGATTVTYRGPQIWKLIPDDIKNVSSHVKRQEISKTVHVGFVN